MFKNVISKKTQNYLFKIINKNKEIKNSIEKSCPIQNLSITENFPKEELNLNLSSILNDPQVDENEIEQDFFETIKYIVLKYLTISIVDEM